MTRKKQYLDINKDISYNFLNIKKIDKNLYKKLKLTINKKISKISELWPIFNRKIDVKRRSLVSQFGHMQGWLCATPGMLSVIG